MLNRLRSVLADKNSGPSLILRILKEHGRPNWRRFALVLVLMAVGAGCTAAGAYLLGSAINAAYIDKSFQLVLLVAMAAIVVSLTKGLSLYGQAVVLARLGNRIVAQNQRLMFDRLVEQDVAYFADKHSAEFTARAAYGASSASTALNMTVTALGRDLLTLIALIVVMVWQAPILALIGLVVMPPSILFVRKLVKRVRGIVLTGFTGGMRIIEIMQETVQGLRIVKALNLEDEMRRRVYEAVDTIEASSNKLARVSNRSTPLMETLGGVAVALILLYGGYEVLIVGRPPGDFVSFIAAFLFAYEPAKRIARLNVDLSSVLVGVQILFDVLDLPVRHDDDNKPALAVKQGRIEFRDVQFSYRPGIPVLRAMSFAAEPGRVTALVGASGGGKSTIFNLLLRLYDIEDGAIEIDGRNVVDVTRKSMRQNISYVGQDVFLFRGSIRDNIALGRLGASETEIVEAAKAAQAHDFIMAFPQGYDSPVGEHGLQLSGGQRQRVAVARALVRNAPIILLDEPTASLDTESERLVHEAISRLSEGRTTLVIAHRLHTITHADMIYVVEDGAVVESGTHDTLLRQSQRYAAFYNIQFERTPVAERRLVETVSDG